MIDIIPHDGVTEWRFASRISRLAGYTASAFLTSDGILIDTGIAACAREFAALLDVTPVRGVIVTHHHEDHAGNVALVAARGLPLWIAAATQAQLTTVAPIRAYRRLTWQSMPPLRHPVLPFLPAPLEARLAPGHCADHHIVWDPISHTLFSGDLFLGVAVRVAHHDEDVTAGIESLNAAAALEPVRMFCAHRGSVPTPAAALRAKSAWTTALMQTVAAEIAGGTDDATILRRVMGRESATGWASRGEYSRRNFIRAVRRNCAATGAPLDRHD